MHKTIEDIAKLANVNNSTVSRALNNNPRISEETRRKILKIADELNYTPNNIARSLKNKKTQTVGLVLHTITNPYWSELLKDIEETMYRNNQDMILFFSGHKDDREAAYMELLMKRKVDGALITLMPTSHPENFIERLEKLKESKFPFVLIFGDANISCNCVSFNHFWGEYLLVRHLISIGHKNICFPLGSLEPVPNVQKMEGYKKALAESNIEFNPGLIIRSDLSKIPETIDSILKINPRPTVISAVDDNMAMAYWRELNSRGIRVPEDIAITGFYDIKYLAHMKFPLTTVKLSTATLSEESIKLLLENIENPDMQYKKIVIEPELVIRESCGAKLVNK